ncbi:MAG: lysophospholipid acyltransferase family protein [Paracoccaceae bacterium]|nr:lysophospholipid acyltransferase family protein [Paracoccaceae bacterium]
MSKAKDPRYSTANWWQDRLLRSLIGALLLLPYRLRVPLSGWLVAYIVAPIAGYRARIRDNLALVFPDMAAAEVTRLCRAVPRNIGRSLIELYSGPEFVARVTRQPLKGPGLAALDAAHKAGRPVILVTGHFGNYDASRAALIARGYRVGGLYRPMNNGWFNDHYVAAISRIGKPLFPRGKKGLGDMIRFLRSGGMLGLVIDQHMGDGARLQFFGRDALTGLSAAELALKYDALVIPTYGIRAENGLDFDIVIEDAIPHGTPEEMTQALNDSLEHLVRTHMDQWFWIHRRWKSRP